MRKARPTNQEMICEGYGKKKELCSNLAKFPKIIPYCNNCAGTYFEDQVAHLFQVQGYRISQNLTLGGTQHDFFAQLAFGFTQIGILVECKWKFQHDDKVNSEDVRKFQGSFDIFKKDQLYGKADQAFLVTNGQFAPEAREVGNRLDIRLLTFQDLINNLVKLDGYWDSLVQQYEDSHLEGHYINLNSTSGASLINEVKEELLQNNALVVLGDYGTGKTSFCLNLCHSLARDAKQGKTNLLPFYIQLKDYNKAITMDSLITNLLVNQCNIPNANIHTFRELLKSVDVILVFDGFDEIAQRVDYSTKYQVFLEICSYAIGNTKILVTCRPNFFNQREEFLRIFKSSPLHFEPTITSSSLEFQEIEIAPLNIRQIRKYILSYEQELEKNGLNYKQFNRILHDVHDLWDLAKRPVLLNVMRETIPKLNREASTTKINAANLYQIYTDFWLKREDHKGKTYIKAQKKMDFVRQLAKKMFMTNSLSISHKSLPAEVQAYFDTAKDPITVEYFTHDIRSCSFLNLDASGNYKFIHKSFMEYFVAKEIITEIIKVRTLSVKDRAKRLNGLLGNFLLSIEIGFFLRDLINNNELKVNDLDALQIHELKNLTAIAQKNLISIIIKVGGNIERIIAQTGDLSGADFSFVCLKNINLTGVNFSGALFYKAIFENVIIRASHLESTFFSHSSFKNSGVVDCSCVSSDLSNCIFNQCQLSGTDFAFSNLNNAKFIQCNFNDSDVTEVKYNEHTILHQCQYVESALGLPYDKIWASNINAL